MWFPSRRRIHPNFSKVFRWSFPLARGRSERPIVHALCKSRPGFTFTVMVRCDEIPASEAETGRCLAASRTQSSNMTLKHALTASLILASASSSVSPSDTQPGISKHSATNIFSSGTSLKTIVKVISRGLFSPLTNPVTWLLISTAALPAGGFENLIQPHGLCTQCYNGNHSQA